MLLPLFPLLAISLCYNRLPDTIQLHVRSP